MNFPIFEFAGITQQIYDDGSGCFHYEVGYLLDVGGSEVVANVYPTTKAQLLQLPMITEDTEITVMQQDGNVSRCIGKSTVREQE